MTLVELLVVVMIMVILLGIAVPLMKPQLADRRIREASRQLNAFIAAAQARAAASGRSVGVWFARTDDVNANISYQIYYAETPPPYVGDTTDARAVFTIVDIPNSTNFVKWQGVGKLSYSWSAAINGSILGGAIPPDDIVTAGDLIQFNHSGPYYVITKVSYNSNVPTEFNTEFEFEALLRDPHSLQQAGAPRHLRSDPGIDTDWGMPGVDDDGNGFTDDAHEIGWPSPDDVLKRLPFQIIRKPQRSTSGSLSLPNGTAVILSLSGMDGVIQRDSMNNLIADHNEFIALGVPNDAVRIMFRPDGSVEQVFYGGSPVGILPQAPIRLLIGSSQVNERIDPALYAPGATLIPPATDDDLTWQSLHDMNNLWVTIGHRTGSVTTAQMQEWQVLYNPADPDADTLVQKTRNARALTASGQSVGGK
jgi:type II secretory pathway pseudopilin PulG